MNFLEAVKAMKEGKRVRRREWDKEQFCTERNWKEKEYVLFTGIEATDWEIVEGEWKLSDKKQTHRPIEGNDYFAYRENDIKTFIQKVKEDIADNLVDAKNNDFYQLFLEIARSIDKRAGDLE